MSQPTRFLITCMASCLLLSVGGRAALAQTPNDDTVRLALLPRVEYGNDPQWLDQGSIWLDQQQQWLGQQQQWFKQLEQDKLLGKVPATGVSYQLKNGPGTGGEALGNLDCKVGVLWDAMPIWQPYVEGSFRGGGITERGELDVFMPLMWSDNALLFADLRGSCDSQKTSVGAWRCWLDLFPPDSTFQVRMRRSFAGMETKKAKAILCCNRNTMWLFIPWPIGAMRRTTV